MHKKKFDEGNHKGSMIFKIQALESIGFEWAQPKGEAAWMRRYHELVEYKQKYGDCEVPTKYASNKALGRWVSTNRAEFKLLTNSMTQSSKLLTPERVKMLDSLGFRW
jgi:hypothetical protein